MPHLQQTSNESASYSIDWSDALAASDSLSSGTWSIYPSSGVTVTDLGESGLVSSCRVSGLTRDTDYLLTNQVVTADGNTFERGITILCEDR